MNYPFRKSLLLAATSACRLIVGRTIAKAGLALVRFLRQSLLYAALFLVAAIAYYSIAQPKWLVYEGPQNCAAYAPQAPAANAKSYTQCLAYNASLTDTAPLTYAGYARLNARDDAEGWADMRSFMIAVLLVGVFMASLESAIRHEIAIRNTEDAGLIVRTDRRVSGPRVIDLGGYPTTHRGPQ